MQPAATRPDAQWETHAEGLTRAARLTRVASGPSPSAVEVRDVHRWYGSLEALRGVDLTVRRGELTAILGPNGAGKTTLLSLILGLRQPSSGSVHVLGDVAGSLAARRRVGAMLQESGVPPTLTVAELIALFGSYYPTARPASEVIAAAGLEGLERRCPRNLSGGQRQRLLFALALCGDPELVVLDEPTTGLDVESRRRFWEVITDLAARGTTVLFATHLLDEADALARRIVVLSGGRIVADGTPTEVKARAGGKTIRVRADIDPQVAATWPGVVRASRVGSTLEILAVDADPVMRQLFATTTRIDELNVVEHSLETAFLDIVKETAR
jgi:ABC-2 type transport system ATP-binding protein